MFVGSWKSVVCVCVGGGGTWVFGVWGYVCGTSIEKNKIIYTSITHLDEGGRDHLRLQVFPLLAPHPRQALLEEGVGRVGVFGVDVEAGSGGG